MHGHVSGSRVCQWVTAWVEGPEHRYSICSFNNADGADRRLKQGERQRESRRQDAGRERTEEEIQMCCKKTVCVCVWIIFRLIEQNTKCEKYDLTSLMSYIFYTNQDTKICQV